MESQEFDHMIGDNSGIFFSTSITIADIIMPDGKSLEHVGVTPDEVVLPTPEDLAAGGTPCCRAPPLCAASASTRRRPGPTSRWSGRGNSDGFGQAAVRASH
jgi:hypothetical protein